MNINIEKDAADYIMKHTMNNSVMIFVKSSSSGWCSVKIPTVQLGKPDMTVKFDLHDINGINVYVGKGIQANNNEIRIYVKKFLWAKDLDVSGISINY